jgi:FAD binding domain
MVVFPTSTNEVAMIVSFSQDHSLDLAVCCGGHHPSASSTDGGICLDLSKMRGVFVDTSTNRVTVQGGARWGEIYTAAEKHGLALVGGTCSDVGVGGLGLVGGYGWLTGAHGLTVDNIIEVEVVLAGGHIVIASNKENSDLYWAMRGAGPCFGVATSIVFQGHPTGLVWHGDLVFPPSAISAIAEFDTHVLQVSKGESSAVMMFGELPMSPHPIVLVSVFHNGSEKEAKKVFAPLLQLAPIVNTTRMKTFSQTTMNNEQYFPRGFRIWTGGSIMAPMDGKYVEGIFKDYQAFIAKVPDARLSVVLLERHPSHGKLLHSQTETSFPTRGAFSNVIIITAYGNEESGTACKQWARYMNNKLRDELERRKVVDDVDETTRTGTGEYINNDG